MPAVFLRFAELECSTAEGGLGATGRTVRLHTSATSDAGHPTPVPTRLHLAPAARGGTCDVTTR